jgi:CHAT domain-containing protein
VTLFRLPMAIVALGSVALLAGDTPRRPPPQPVDARAIAPRGSSPRAACFAPPVGSRDPRYLSDLAAACLRRADRAGEPELLVRALDYANRLEDPSASPAAALFNRALSRDRLSLTEQAKAAWSDYLVASGDAAGREVARARLTILCRTPGPGPSGIAQLRDAAYRGDTIGVDGSVQRLAQPARELAQETLLGEWADRQLAGSAADAGRSLRAAGAIAGALLAARGDRSVEALVSVARRIQVSRAPRKIARLARAHQDFRAAMAAFRKLDMNQARRAFAAAAAGGAASGSPIELWARAGGARILALEGEHAAAAASFEALAAEARRRSFVSLAAWCEWGLGWLDSRRDRFESATRHFLNAAADYSRLEEAENGAAISSYLAENLASLGRVQEAWRHRQAVLAALADYPASLRRHVALMDAARSAVEAGQRWAALVLQNEALAAATAARDPVRLTECRWARARILIRLGRTEEAMDDLERAAALARQAPAGAPREKLIADLAWARAAVVGFFRPQEALRCLTAAIPVYERQTIPLSLAYASFDRGRLFLRRGALGAAAANLGRALDVLEDLSSHLEEADLRSSHSDSIQDVYDELIRLQWQAQRRPLDALATLERARHVGPAPEVQALRSRQGLPAVARQGRATTIEYGVLRDRLLIWRLTGNKVASWERPIGQRQLEALVEGFRDAILLGAAPEELRERASALYDLLLPYGTESRGTLRLVVDKCLNRLPFSALFNRRSGSFLIEEHSLVLTPSLAAFAGRQGEQAPPASALLVADPAVGDTFSSLPALPGTRLEVAAARPLFRSSTVLEGRAATKARILGELKSAGIFIFAGHAVSNAGRPSQSYLVVAPTGESGDLGTLLAKDLAGRQFPVLQAVVLASCNSVGSRSARSLGITGLARPFLAAGAGSVIGSLWSVQDDPTAAFLHGVYGALAAGRPAVEALRSAQLSYATRQDRSWRELPVWAGFVCVST